jgi:hypothetical protein
MSGQPVRVSAPRLERGREGARLSATIQFDDASWDVYFETPDVELLPSPDPFLALALPAAMRHQRELIMESPVSRRLLASLPQLQTVFVRERSLTPVKVHAAADTTLPRAKAAGTGLFFSGGVDSYHALVDRETEISHLVFVHGFDIHVEKEELHQVVLPVMQRAAMAFGKPLLRLRTNLRGFTDAVGDWGFHFFGPAQAAVALALAPAASRFYIAGEKIRSDFYPASRLELDPLWSTEVSEIIHTGHEVSRFEKLRRIGGDPRIQCGLRVCWENPGGRFNCCECVKCQRNMCALRALGLLEEVTSFDRPLDLKRVSERLCLATTLHHDEFCDIAAHLKPENEDPELLAAVERVLQRFREAERKKRMRQLSTLPRRAVAKVWRLAKASLAPKDGS